MSTLPILRLGTVKDVERFQAHVQSLGLTIPCDSELVRGNDSPMRAPLKRGGITIGNRIAVQTMEGWDGTADGNPSEHRFERWKKFGRSGAKLIWGGEAVAVTHAGRANPNQLVIAEHTKKGLAKLRRTSIEEHIRTTGSEEGLLIGLQLTHSGRYCRPNQHDKPEPQILYHHPILDRKLGLPADYPVLTDGEIEGILEKFHDAAKIAEELGFDFVDIKHCHGYLGHEFLSAHTREGKFGGKSLFQSTYSAAGAVSTVRRVSTGRRPADQRGAANECDARIEATISEFDCRWNCVHIFAGLFAACGTSGDPRWVGGRSWDGKNDFDLPRTVARCERRKSY